MKSLFKWSAIAVCGLLAIIIVAGAALYFFLPLDKIKGFATTKLSETIHREVRIDKVSFNIFSGIKLQGLYVGNRTGFAKQPLISADAIELHYAFWPLFSRQLIIKEVSLVKPEILVEKNARGEYNFSDLLTTQPANNPAAQPPNHQTTKPPFDLFVSSFSIKNAKLTYADHAAGTVNEVKDFNLKVGGFALALVKPIDLAASAVVTYQGKEIPLSLGGQVGVNLASENISLKNFSLSIAGESLALTASLSNWGKAPRLSAAISSRKFNLDPLLAIFAGGAAKSPAAKPKPGELTKTVNSLTAAIPRNVSATVSLDIADLTFQQFTVDKIDAVFRLANKDLLGELKEVRFYGGVLTGKL
ncbi:MAG TPA: AsmA family protein, partial [Candidatus Sulfotelmatobacter sp.]|nr:AsmA family protein [Candidatus Sulfotelmatobacter sp.]